ncbi:MAG: peptide methionine sulfoxide reductase [Desulfobacter postgatei]|uniref:Peptide methionine sulfoxide reductase MsrA n=1 Tax=Desulfobacter postgatei TaxID=2293 RepID=A0A2G6MQD9_9BACT|nr:MAG: peptide methionine sulfoxide reductase [Desulfobacter postgatei]
MKKIILFLVFALIAFTGCNEDGREEDVDLIPPKHTQHIETDTQIIKTIYLAGGCFWGVEGYFQRVKGVVDTDTGYANGNTETTSYQALKYTDHAETVRVDYDIAIISLEEILLHYFSIIDPVSLNKQGNDSGRQYRTGVYYTDINDLPVIEKIFSYEEDIHGDLAVEKMALKNFVKAEEYHQDYLEKNPRGYCHIDLNQAEEPLFKKEYKNPEEAQIKETLDELSYSVLRENDTELRWSSPLNSEYRKGIYLDKITGEPLFASKDKFDSGSGWPSFSKPILAGNVTNFEDQSYGMNRIEVRSSGGDNHLGHVFTDGLEEKGGLRYCINGAALTFIPYEEMEEEGYKEYMVLL